MNLKIGQIDITKDRVTECLILNKTLKCTPVVKPVGLNNEKISEVKIELDQYHQIWDKKSSPLLSDIMSNHLELWGNQTSITQLEKSQKKILVSHVLSMKVAGPDSKKGQQSSNAQNQNTYEKWMNKFDELHKSRYFNEKKKNNQVKSYIKALQKIKQFIKELI